MQSNRRIHSFKGFINEMNGYGDKPFYFAKKDDTHNYLFKVEADDNGHRGFVISIGKFSQFTQPTEAKTDYGVIGITELAEKELDQAVTDEGVFETNDKLIDVDDKTLAKIMDTLEKAVENYLGDNAKVARFYDEMQSKIKVGSYIEKVKDSVGQWPGEWNFQEVERGRLNMMSK